MNAAELTGREHSHVVQNPDGGSLLHAHVVTPFSQLRRAARADGIDLIAVSSFRDFDRQLSLWNEKFNGVRPLLDADGQPLDAAALNVKERIAAILLWSALPGASRHHWGTDVDLLDNNADAAGYADKLTQRAFAAGGPFATLTRWLDAYAVRFGFFRPFRGIRSGVQPEPWHFSFAPIAENARRALTVGVLRSAIEAAPLAGKEWVLEHLEELHHRFVARIDSP